MELGQTPGLEQLLLGEPDQLLFDFLGGEQGRNKGAATLAPHDPAAARGLRCLDASHAAGCTTCAPEASGPGIALAARRTAGSAWQCLPHVSFLARADAHGPRNTRRQLLACASDGGGPGADRA